MRGDLRAYWKRRGRRYFREFRGKPIAERARYDRQALEWRRVLGTLGPVRSVLELACGFGRITTVVRTVFPGADLVACDLSPAQVRNARKFVPNTDFIVADATTLNLRRTFDLVIASEFFMHLPEDDFSEVMDKVSAWSSRLAANVDYTGSDTLSPTRAGLVYQFRHDYPRAYRERGFETVLEYPVDRQSIFVAERDA